MIQSEAFISSRLRHGFFTRLGGHSTGMFSSLNCGMGSGDDKQVVAKNRAVVAEALGVVDGDHLLSAWQVHSAAVATVGAPWGGAERPRVDAMVTATPGLAIGILTADCSPVLFADENAGVIGAAHAGWKGALGGITGATLDAMVALGARRSNIVAVLGPTISQAAYEVGPEFPRQFLDADSGNARYFVPSPRKGHAMFDLPAYLANRLRMEGAGMVVDLGHCTFSDEKHFFSYRRTTHRAEKDYGRQISAIALTQD
jgi:polyphenol oxidase